MVRSVSAADVWGVTEIEIVVGTHSDMTGPAAEAGIGIRFGTALAFEEVNTNGGIHGRKLRLVAEDTSGDPEKAHRAIRKLLTKDNVFAVLSPHGTLPVMATLDVILKNNVPHLFPFAAPTIGEGKLHAYNFVISPTFKQQLGLGLEHLTNETEIIDIGTIYQSDSVGEDVARSVDAVAAEQGLTVASKNRHDGNVVDIETLVSRLYANSVDAIILHLPPHATKTALATIKQYKWSPSIICVGGCYDERFASKVGAELNGAYTVSHLPIPLANDPKDSVRQWWQNYKRRFGRDPNRHALDAYVRAQIFIAALHQIGRRPTPQMLVQGLEGMPSWSDWRFTANAFDFSSSNHTGAQKGFLARHQGGHWIPVTDYMELHRQEAENQQASINQLLPLD